MAAYPRRSRANRPTSSAAMCWASAADPPLPNTSTFPSCRSEADMAAAAAAAVSRPAARTRSCSAIASRSVASATSLPRKAILQQVRPELLFRHLRRRSGLRLHLDLHRVVLPGRITLPVLRHQEPPRIGMTVERNAEHVPDFALEPVGCRPDDSRRRE